MAFITHGPLPANSPLFVGRKGITTTLSRACTKEVKAYQLVCGSRQTGKTSLLQHLLLLLQQEQTTVPCHVNFQLTPEASIEEALLFLCKRIEEELPSGGCQAPDTLHFGGYEVAVWLEKVQLEKQVVLLIEEMGALSGGARKMLPRMFRAWFDERYVRKNFLQVMIVLFGGIELFESALQIVSPLRNVCNIHYLADLSEERVGTLLRVGFAERISPGEDPGWSAMVQAIYELTAGHPQLAQNLGELALKHTESTGRLPALKEIRELAAELPRDCWHLRDLCAAVQRYRLQEAARRLLEQQHPPLEGDPEMEMLRLLGVASWTGEAWDVRNPMVGGLLERCLASPARVVPPQGFDMEPEAALAHRRQVERPAVFISYAHEDNEGNTPKERWLDRLLAFLKPVARILDIRCWSDLEIPESADWKGDIETQLEAAAASILLVSPDFLASDFIMNQELPHLLRRREEGKLTLFIIHVSPSGFDYVRVRYYSPKAGQREVALKEVKSVNDPNQTLLEMDRAGQDRTLLKVCNGLVTLFRSDPVAGSEKPRNPGVGLTSSCLKKLTP